MTQQAEIVPGKLTARGAAIGTWVVSLLMVFGLVLAVVVLMETSFSSEPGLAIVMCLFWLVWIGACIGIIVQFRRVVKASRQSGTDTLAELRFDPPAAPGGGPGDLAPGGDIETRLRHLDKLRNSRMISEEEYLAQRARILQEL